MIRSALLLPLVALTLGAADFTVRLYSVHSPSEVRILRGGMPPRTVRGNDAGAVTLEGPFTIESPEHGKLRIDFPAEIRPERGRVRIVVRMPSEAYVAGVLAGESSVFKSAESIKAMAVAARTYAVRFRDRHRAEGFDLCDTTHCQDLRLGAVTERLLAAAEATEGEILWHQGTPAAAYYHRHCGGEIEAAHEVWPNARARYLRSRHDAFCLERDGGRWRGEMRLDELTRALREAGFRPREDLHDIEILERSGSGRARMLRVGGLRLPAATLHAAVGQSLGWNRLRSTFYEVRLAGDRVIFDGRGFGHGVGLCQIGAARMGEEGKGYREILASYYPDTKLGINAQGFAWQRLGGERVDLRTTRPDTDAPVAALADRLLADAEVLAGWRLGWRPSITLYPSVAAYRDATGEPGWIAASARGPQIRMQPPAVLRGAGTLESTLRHELLHLLVEQRARPGLPLWFREGLVLYLELPNRPAQGSGAVSDRLLESPRSREELQSAYEAARSRVKRLVDERGRGVVLGWLERGLPGDLLQ